MAFPPGFLDELRTRISLAELIGRRVRLTRRGREYVGLCPFHNEKTPSFCVVEDKGFFHCFGCGAHGDAIGYAMRADNVDFVEAVERLAGVAGIVVPESTPMERERAQRQKTLLEAMEAAAQFYEKRLWSPFGRAGLDYLRARGLDDETIRRFRLGWAPEERQTLRRALSGEYPEALLLEAGLVRASDRGGDPYDYFGNRVMFPITDRAGRVIAFGARTLGDDQPKYLNSPDTPLFEKGRVLYAWAAARAQIGREGDVGGNGVPGGVIVTEGYMDVIALHRAGFATAVAPLGTALTETQLQELWRLSPEPVLCFDGDSAGQRAALRGLNRALPLLKPGKSLRFAVMPAGEDPDSLIQARGPNAFAEVLAAARPLVDVLWQAELAERPVDTPERRADLKARLDRRAGEVADGEVQREYRRVLTDRYYMLTRGNRDFRGPQSRFGPRRFGPMRTEPPPPPPIPGRAHRQIFLGLLLRHPVLIGEWVEELAELDLPEPDLDRLQREILENCEAFAGLDAEGLRQHLGSTGFADTVGALGKAIVAHAGFATGGEDDPHAIRNGLGETLTLLRAQAPGDLDAAERAFGADASDENWQRLKALKEREAEDGPVGGLGL
ncbi:MAG TPA: DNA primase [Stellaceae bacterium]|jgi:DNA primase|nr:DNA primase [Stellaceae bacterium]